MIISSSFIIPFSGPPTCDLSQVHSTSACFDLRTSSGWFPHVVIKVLIRSFVRVCGSGGGGAKGAEKDGFDEQRVTMESKEKILRQLTPRSRSPAGPAGTPSGKLFDPKDETQIRVWSARSLF